MFTNQGGKEFLVDSRKVAKLFGVAHQHLRERIEAFESEMTQLGVFQFETGKFGFHQSSLKVQLKSSALMYGSPTMESVCGIPTPPIPPWGRV